MELSESTATGVAAVKPRASNEAPMRRTASIASA